MKTTIIVPLYNGSAVISACLASLQAQTDLAEPPQILVVENGSQDDGPDLAAAFAPAVTLLRFAQPLGFAGAVNAGLRVALAQTPPPEALVLLNQDTVVDPGWLAALLAPLADPAVGIVGSCSRLVDGTPQHLGASLTTPLWYGRNLSDPADPAPLDFLSGFAVALRPAMLAAIGLFDEAFSPAYFEDVDLCLRATAAGWQLHLAQAATLVHQEGSSRGSEERHAATIERNRWRLLLKHRPLTELLDVVLPAERLQVHERAEQGMSRVLRQAYLHAMLSLPTLGAARGWSAAAITQLSTALAELRTLATQIERTSRTQGLKPVFSTLPEPSELETAADQAELPEAVALVAPRKPQPAPRPPFTVGERPPVSIVILTWNGLPVTQTCLTSLRAHTSGVTYQLIVVDNGSTDGTVEWLREQPDVTLVTNRENRGFAAGVNQGIALVPPDHDLLLLNNDTEMIEDHWLAHLREVANDHPDYGLVGCLLLHSDGSLQHAGTYMPQHTFWGYQIGGGEAFVGQYPGIRTVEGITGACMYIRRDVRATIGGLSERYFSYYEDTDYCLRATQAGFTIVCTGGAKLIHHENTSTKLNNADWLAMFSRGQRIFLSTWRDYYARRYQRAIVWHSLIAHSTGYTQSSREFVRELDRLGVDVRLACIFGTDYTEPLTKDPRLDQLRTRPKDTRLTQIVYSQADAFIKNSGRYRIGYTMFEADRLPVDWSYQSNRMDEIWVPAEFTREVFELSGVRQPIHVMPLGFNPNYFHPQIQRQKPSERFVFLSVFEWIERKAPNMLVRAYVEEFRASDDVLLVLKIFNHDQAFNLRRHIAELTSDPGAPPIAILLNQDIAEYQMGTLYRSADCFVLPTRGEGWGLPILEAMACGLPVIATDWGAQREFFSAEVGYPIESRGLVPAVARSPYYAGARWAEPDLEHMRARMRYVYEHPDEARMIGARAATAVHNTWTWELAAKRMLARLEEIEA